MDPTDRGSSRVAVQARGAPLDAARRRAAVETYARHEAALRRTARRYSICEDDAEDALQRALEILLRKAPSDDQRELIKWTQTVVKHEALAVRRERERILAGPAGPQRDDEVEDWVALIPAPGDGPPERAERREAIARSREALQSLKPQELRTLTLLAEGYSYREIGEITGFSATKINRCLAEGRERFRRFLARSASGGRCEELGPLISAFCDGEAGAEEARAVREHLRACANCRATLRAYRAAPRAAAALAPTLPAGRPLLDRAQEAIGGLAARLGGGGGGAASDSALTQVAAAGGTRGAGIAALAKVFALCVGSVGGAAACVATGVVPDPIAVEERPAIERTAESPEGEPASETQPEPEATEVEAPTATADEGATSGREEREPAGPSAAPETESGAVEYVPPPAPVASTRSAAGTSGSAAAAGEFGP